MPAVDILTNSYLITIPAVLKPAFMGRIIAVLPKIAFGD
jgi:hypothetical protein